MHTELALECLTQLIQHPAYSSIVILSQIKGKIRHQKISYLILKDSTLDTLQEDITGNDLFIFQDSYFDSESTTSETFIQNNYILPLRIALYGKKNNVNQSHIVTGASTLLKSVFMPHKAKEELEQSIRSLNYWACYIYKPLNVLTQSNTLREIVSSFLMDKMNKVSDGLLNKFVPIDQESLVKLMIQNAQQLEKGVHVLKNEDICKIQNDLKKNLE